VVPLVTAARASFPVREVDAAEAAELSHGRRIPSAPAGPAGTREAPVAAVAPDGGLVALLADADGVARPVLVLRPA
jgi:tRNA pseudouridine55 synthase